MNAAMLALAVTFTAVAAAAAAHGSDCRRSGQRPARAHASSLLWALEYGTAAPCRRAVVPRHRRHVTVLSP